jgi:hypothetical protein
MHNVSIKSSFLHVGMIFIIKFSWDGAFGCLHPPSSSRKNYPSILGEKGWSLWSILKGKQMGMFFTNIVHMQLLKE